MISFSNINKQYGKQLLFVDDSFQLNPGEKVGLVGPNGQARQCSFLLEANGQAGREAVLSDSSNPSRSGSFLLRGHVGAIAPGQVMVPGGGVEPPRY
jgi:ABC-type multidrug transport system fused ATPase/permease subunit